MVRVELEVEARTQDVLPQEAGFAGFFQGLFKALVDLENLAVDVVVAHGSAHRETADDHAFDHGVRVVAQDVAVLEGPGLAFVGVADDVFLAGDVARHEGPFQARREARAAAAAQVRGLQFGDHVVGRHARQDFFQGLVTAARHVVADAPVVPVQVGQDLRLDVAAMEDHAAGRDRRPDRAPAHPWRISAVRPARSCGFLQFTDQGVDFFRLHAAAHVLAVGQHHGGIATGAHAFAFDQGE